MTLYHNQVHAQVQRPRALPPLTWSGSPATTAAAWRSRSGGHPYYVGENILAAKSLVRAPYVKRSARIGNLTVMAESNFSCELVDERDLDTRYLSGRLSPEEAEGFEAHFFGCERCWGLVQQGLAVQAAHDSPEPQAMHPTSAVPPRSTSARPALRPRPWWGLAAAAVLVLAVVGIRQLGLNGERTGSDDILRGGVKTLPVSAGVSGTRVTAAWPRVPETDVYRVRLYAADGTLAAESEVSDTAVSLDLNVLDKLPPGAEAFWEVQALDRLRNPIARSELTKAVLPISSR